MLNWLWVQNYAQFYCLDLNWWLAYFKICLIFGLGGLGLRGHTVTQLPRELNQVGALLW